MLQSYNLHFRRQVSNQAKSIQATSKKVTRIIFLFIPFSQDGEAWVWGKELFKSFLPHLNERIITSFFDVSTLETAILRC